MMVFHLLLYLLLYFSVVLVICITGHLLMGALLLIAVAAYGPVLSVTLQFYEYAFYYTSSAGVYGFIKGLREMASPVILAYTFVGKYAEENYGGILGIVLLVTNRFWRSWILCICKQKIRKNRYGLCFSMGWHNHKIYDCGSRRTWNRTYFLYASK